MVDCSGYSSYLLKSIRTGMLERCSDLEVTTAAVDAASLTALLTIGRFSMGSTLGDSIGTHIRPGTRFTPS